MKISNGNVENVRLTKEQTECVNFHSGNLLIRGVPGSGKSYVILKRAVKLHKEKKEQETVAIFTYTNALVKYTDDLVQAKLGEGQMKVLTVDSYCWGIYKYITRHDFHAGSEDDYKRIVKDTLDQHQKDSQPDHRFYRMDVEFFKEEFKWLRERCIKTKGDYMKADRKGRGSRIRLSKSDKELLWSIFELYRKNAKKAGFQDWPDMYIELNENIHRIPDFKKIDYILIDEAQDMTVGKLRVLNALCRKSLTIAADVAQKIYKTSFTWKEVGIDISGRSSKALSKSFRSTRQIVELAEDLMEYNRKKATAADGYTPAVLPQDQGDKPMIIRCKMLMDEKDYLIKWVKGYAQEGDAVIGIICRTFHEVADIKKLLDSEGLHYEVVDNKKKWSLLTPGIKIVTAHSSKGLEFDRVIIPYLDDSIYPFKTYRIDESDEGQMEEYLKTERNILYVAMTRARATLAMLCINSAASRFIDEFRPEHYDVVDV